MGASWVEIETLLNELETVTAFPHAEALPAVTRARDTVAQTAMAVAIAGVSGERRAERETQDLLARARVALMDARTAVRRATEACEQFRSGLEQSEDLVARARALRARDTKAQPTITAPAVCPRFDEIVPRARA